MIQHQFEEDLTATAAVIETVSAASGTEPIELPPLYDTIDPEALDALFESGDGGANSDVRIEFAYNGYNVAVQDSLQVTIRER